MRCTLLSCRNVKLIDFISMAAFLLVGCHTKTQKRQTPLELIKFEKSRLSKGTRASDSIIAIVYDKIRELDINNNDSIISLAFNVNRSFMTDNSGGESELDRMFADTTKCLSAQRIGKMMAIQSVLFPILRKEYVANLNDLNGSDIYSTDGKYLFCDVNIRYKDGLLKELINEEECFELRFKGVVIHYLQNKVEEHNLSTEEDSALWRPNRI